MSKRYQEEENFRLSVKKLLALAFVPINDITLLEDFGLVAVEFDDGGEEFIDYFEKTWIGEPKKRGK